MSSLFGEKIYKKKENGEIDNIGAVILYENQQRHYLDYFMLLTTLWEYMPSEAQINDLRLFIKKYYKEKIYLDLFNMSVEKNKNFLIKYKNYKKIINYYNISSI